MVIVYSDSLSSIRHQLTQQGSLVKLQLHRLRDKPLSVKHNQHPSHLPEVYLEIMLHRSSKLKVSASHRCSSSKCHNSSSNLALCLDKLPPQEQVYSEICNLKQQQPNLNCLRLALHSYSQDNKVVLKDQVNQTHSSKDDQKELKERNTNS